MPWGFVLQPCSPRKAGITQDAVYLKAGVAKSDKPESPEQYSTYKLTAPSGREGMAPGHHAQKLDDKAAVVVPFWWALCSTMEAVDTTEGALPPVGLATSTARFVLPVGIALPKGNDPWQPVPLKKAKQSARLALEVPCLTNAVALAAAQQVFFKV